MKRGYRLVKDDNLDTYIKNSWFNPQYVRAEMQKIVDGFNSLSFVRKLRKEINQLRERFHELHEQIEELRIKNQVQKNLLEKTKHIRLDNGKTVYEEITAPKITEKPKTPDRPKQQESDRNVRQNNHPAWDDDER